VRYARERRGGEALRELAVPALAAARRAEANVIRIRRKTFNSTEIQELRSLPEDGSAWVDVVKPSDAELDKLAEMVAVDRDVLRAALDDEELPRLEVEEDYVMVILDVPQVERDMEDFIVYQTYPLGIIHAPRAFVTVRLYDSHVLDRFVTGGYRAFSTHKRSRFTVQIVREVAAAYVNALRSIDTASTRLEMSLRKSMQNSELIQMLSLGKSLVYFSTSLKANQGVLRRMARNALFTEYEEDAELLEDAVLETEQAMEMAEIYTNILNSTMDALASVISNNLNVVMKVLTSAAIVMAVPTVIASWYGMNVIDIPLAETPGAFWIVVAISILLGMAIGWWLRRRNLM
jgi:magnesium transporter